MRTAIKLRLKFASMLAGDALIFFFIAALLALFFYLAGTVREFAESTQILLLKIMFGASIGFLLFAALWIALTISISILRRELARPKKIVLCALCCILSLALVFLSGAILVLTGGNKI
jgi:hypothetical protein